VWSPDGSLIALVGNLRVAGDLAWQPIHVPADTASGRHRSRLCQPSWSTFAVGVRVCSVVCGEGSVWVAASNDDGTSAGRIVRIDPETHEVQGEIPVEVIPAWEVGGGAMVVDAGSLWVTGAIEGPGTDGITDAAVIRIDTSTNEVAQTFDLGGDVGNDLTIVNGELWGMSYGERSFEVARVGFVEADDRGDLVPQPDLEAAGGRVLDVFDPVTGEAAALVELDEESPVRWRSGPTPSGSWTTRARSRASASAEPSTATMGP
jgi:hypothetical protein